MNLPSDCRTLIDPLLTIAGLIAVFAPFTLGDQDRIRRLAERLKQKEKWYSIAVVQLFLPTVYILPWLGVCLLLVNLIWNNYCLFAAAFLVVSLSCLISLALLSIAALEAKGIMEFLAKDFEDDGKGYHDRDKE